MSEIAFNINGEAFDVPPGAAYWRPRRVRDRGLEVVYRREGCSPLMLPISITAEEFQREVGQPGKYRLDALDEEYQPIEGLPPAYLVIAKPEAATAPAALAPSPQVATNANDNKKDGEMSELASLLREVVRVNAEVSRTLAERYAAVLESAAHLVRAADGAGMPARVPPEPRNSGLAPDLDDLDDDDLEDDDQGSELDRWSAFAREWAPSILRSFGFEPGGAPRNANGGASNEAAQTAKRTKVATKAASQPQEPSTPPAEQAPIPKMTPAIMMRLHAIKSRLTEEEAAFLKQVYGELSQEEVAHWMAELAAIPVDDAVAMLRAKIAASGTQSEGVAS